MTSCGAVRVHVRDSRSAACVLAATLAIGSLPFLGGCGGSSTPATSTTTPVAIQIAPPHLTLTPAFSSLTTVQTLAVNIGAAGASGQATPTGSVTLSSGSYASFPISLASGAASITVPAGLLAPGTATLTAVYTPDAASTSTYSSATATASISVSSAAVTPTLTTGPVATYATAGAPFQAAVSADGSVLVSVSGAQTGVQVFKPAASGLNSTCVNPLAPALVSEGAAISDLGILPNGMDLAAGIGVAGAIFLNLTAVEICSAPGVVISQGTVASDQGTQAVAVTPDGKYAFVSNEYGVANGATTEGNIGVVALQYDSSGNVTAASSLLGQISTGGSAIAGMTLSPDGERLYVTSEIAGTSNTPAGSSNPVLARTGCVQQTGGTASINGTLTVINVAAAEATPGSSAILSTVDAGCSPVRMAESADGSTLWVAARGDNRVLAFSTGMLELNPANALLGYADTGGTAPVGLRLLDNDHLLAVANSNRFDTGVANLTILSVAVPAAAQVLQTVPSGLFPREVTLAPDGTTLYLTNYTSHTLEVIPTVTH